jgi:hypothetical protein
MSNPYNGSKNGMRGGSNFRPSRKPFHPPETHKVSTSALVAESGKYFACAEVEEQGGRELANATAALNPKVPCIRESITRRQHLGLFSEVELEDRVTRQLDTKSGRVVETTSPRVVWRSDKTLLRKGKPDQLPTFVRVTSRTKRRRFEREVPAVMETPTPVEIDTEIE